MPSARGDVTAAFAQDVLTREGAFWVREATSSMLPLIRPGDELRLAPVGPRRLVRGMLIAYQREPGLVVHRVVACDETGVVAKGDALAAPDPVVPPAQVVARVIALRRANGRLVDLEAFPWPVVNRVLGAIASFACRLSLGDSLDRVPSPLRFIVWKAHRLPFHVARLFLR